MKLCGFDVGLDKPFFLIAGPCVVESEQLQMDVAGQLKEMTAALGIPFVFKSSYDKANRSSSKSYRGPGLAKGLKMLEAVRKKVISASIYPILLMVAGTLVLLFLLGYVIPRFSMVYEDVKGNLPLVSRLLLELGTFISAHGPLLAVAALGSLALGGGLGVVAVLLKQEILLLFIGGVFVVEALSVILQVGSYKLRGGKRIFKMAPLHHHFEQLGWPESKVIARFWIAGLVMALFALTTLKLR